MHQKQKLPVRYMIVGKHIYTHSGILKQGKHLCSVNFLYRCIAHIVANWCGCHLGNTLEYGVNLPFRKVIGVECHALVEPPIIDVNAAPLPIARPAKNSIGDGGTE